MPKEPVMYDRCFKLAHILIGVIIHGAWLNKEYAFATCSSRKQRVDIPSFISVSPYGTCLLFILTIFIRALNLDLVEIMQSEESIASQVDFFKTPMYPCWLVSLGICSLHCVYVCFGCIISQHRDVCKCSRHKVAHSITPLRSTSQTWVVHTFCFYPTGKVGIDFFFFFLHTMMGHKIPPFKRTPMLL